MRENSAHEVQREVGQSAVVALRPGEDRFPVLEQLHVDVHAVSGLAVEGLGHERRGAAPFGRHVFDEVLDQHRAVGEELGLSHRDLDLLLSGAADLVVVVLHGDAELVDRRGHIRAKVAGRVRRGVEVIAALAADRKPQPVLVV